jgi:antitoxin (DNA-binding transcriptional repressor) of toxin-antitoxin stability system
MHFPGFSEAAPELLIAERDVVGIGIDTLPIDPGSGRSWNVEWDEVRVLPLPFPPAIAAGSDTQFSYSIRKQTQTGSTLTVDTISCGGTTPDLCSTRLARKSAHGALRRCLVPEPAPTNPLPRFRTRRSPASGAVSSMGAWVDGASKNSTLEQYMSRSVSLVAARKDLGRIVEEVGRTGNPVSLTRRGKVVARIVPEERGGARDPLGALRGTAELRGTFGDLTREVRELRAETGAALERRASRRGRTGAKRRV